MTTSQTDVRLPMFLDTPNAAELLALERRTLERWRCTGCGPRFRKHGGRVVYAVADLLAWSDEQARNSTSDPGARAR